MHCYLKRNDHFCIITPCSNRWTYSEWVLINTDWYKELIVLRITTAVHCDGCIGFHVHDALIAGATPREILEAIGGAILMGGGPCMVYDCEAMELLSSSNKNKTHPCSDACQSLL
jgi:AhpD family alkylhydroperoxidase